MWIIRHQIHSVERSRHRRGNVDSRNTGEEYDKQKEALTSEF